MIHVKFLTTTDDNRKVSKRYTVNSENVAIDIYDSCDLYNPTLIVKSNNVINSNYLYITNFKRFYFIVNKNLDKSGITVINCECDVLMSFKNDILNSTQLVIRSADTSNEKVKNSKIADTLRPISPLEFDGKVRVTGWGLENKTPGGFILTTMGGSNGKFAQSVIPTETKNNSSN